MKVKDCAALSVAISIKQSKDGKYRVVLERELAEAYIVEEDKGFNIPYLIASILVYVLFFGFLLAVWRKGKKNKSRTKIK